MPRKTSPTTLQVSRRLIVHIRDSSEDAESIDDTLRRLLSLGPNPSRKNGKPIPLASTIKISQDVMSEIVKKSKEGESRDATLSRLLGVLPSDGNVREEEKSNGPETAAS